MGGGGEPGLIVCRGWAQVARGPCACYALAMDAPHLPPIDIQPGQWQPVLAHLFERYEHMIQEAPPGWDEDGIGQELSKRVLALCRHGRAHIDEMAEDKANRWLGFVQGVLTVGGLIDVEVERDYTRPLFHALHGASRSWDVRPK